MSAVILLVCLLVAAPAAAQRAPGAVGGTQRPGPLAGGRVQRPPRDAREPAAGTAVIRGRVVAADTGTPLRRVQVRAFSGELRESRMASTDAQGRFELRDLPAGRWQLMASKAGFVALRFGQRRPFESGRPIELAEGTVMTRADFVLPRGAAITGRIVDEFGDPVATARVAAVRYRSIQGSRRLVPVGITDQTDDTGAFRLFGLPPGEYYVTATLYDGGGEGSTDTTAYAPTYYPGSGNLAEAQRVAVGIGQEQSNVSFALLPIRTVRLTGSAIDSQGRPLTRGFVSLLDSAEPQLVNVGMMPRAGARIRPDGTFTIANVAPGSYTLHATTGMGQDNAEFASMPITVGNEDLTGISVATGGGATLTGTVAAAEGSAGKLNVWNLQIFAQPAGGEFMMMGSRPVPVEDDGAFRVTGLHGRRLLRIQGLPPEWTLKAVLLNGTDVTDSPLEFKSSEEVTGVQVIVTDRTTEVAGKVTDQKGEPTRDYTVVVFPEDPARWTYPSRYVRSGRADQQGLFRIRGLPPDDRYLAVAVDYLEDGQGGDPEFLNDVKERGSKFSLAEGEARVLDLKVIER